MPDDRTDAQKIESIGHTAAIRSQDALIALIETTLEEVVIGLETANMPIINAQWNMSSEFVLAVEYAMSELLGLGLAEERIRVEIGIRAKVRNQERGL